MTQKQKRILLGSIVTCVIWASTLGGYNLTRRRLTRPGDADWRTAIITVADSGSNENSSLHLSGRAQVVGIREFLLEHANTNEPRLEFELAYALAEMPAPNWTAVEETFASTALKIVRNLSRDPALKDFEDAGMRVDQSSYRMKGFPKPVLFTDIEQRGSRDVLLGFPSSSDGVCVLLRKSGGAWEAIPLSMGEELAGMWETHLGRGRRPALAMLFGTGDDYETRQRMVIWIWRNNRLERALTVPVPTDRNWRMEFTSDAIKPTVMKGSPQNWRSASGAIANLVFHWNGSTFDEAPKPGGEAVDERSFFDQAKNLIAKRNYSEAVRRLDDAFLTSGTQSLANEEAFSAYYTKSICEATLGNFAGFRRDISTAATASAELARANGYSSDEGNVCGRYFKEATSADKLVDVLLSDGKAMVMLRAMADRLGCKPDEIIVAAHLKLEKMQTVHFAATSNPDYITEVSWKGRRAGSAVLDWRIARGGHGWTTRLLAYGETARLDSDANERHSRSDAGDLFESGSTSDSALQVIPAPGSVHLGAITEGPDGRVHIRYVNRKGSGVGNLIYVEGEFIDESNPYHRTVQDIEEGVDSAEEKIFAGRDFVHALEDLQDLEVECEDLRIEPGDQKNWMGEICYCQAICLRHLGDNRGADNLLNALQSLANWNRWRSLAGLWLK